MTHWTVQRAREPDVAEAQSAIEPVARAALTLSRSSADADWRENGLLPG
ncbi:MAG TPA: hypothetical protein VF815_32915 [Myxococcaceae bacterium]